MAWSETVTASTSEGVLGSSAVGATLGNGHGYPSLVLGTQGSGDQGVVTSAKGVPEAVQVFASVSNNRANPNSPKEVSSGAGRSNQLTPSSERLGSGGVLTEQGVTTNHLEAENEVEGTCDTVLLHPVERPEAAVLEGGGEARGGVKGQLGGCVWI
jgi:hypothetical protein